MIGERPKRLRNRIADRALLAFSIAMIAALTYTSLEAIGVIR